MEDLKEWASFTEEQVTKAKTSEKVEDKAVEGVQKLKTKLTTKAKDASSESNIKKLLVGKMASLSRR